jgi:predicted ATPase
MTRRLAGAAVRAEPMVRVTARGKSAPVPAHRLVGLQEVEPSSGSTFAGRDAELGFLRAGVAAACRGDGRAMTVLGDAGIGKSRIVAELLARDCAHARVLRGRCLSYGEGIAFWPLREAFDRLTAAEDRTLAALLERDADPAELADRLNRLVGRAHGAISAEDGAVAVRRMLAALAADGPLVVVVEDVHWAEAALLDILEDLVAAPVPASCLILTARPEFRDRHPRLALTAITLGPLAREDAAVLIEGVPADRRAALLDAADGNPLFLEQLAAGIEPGGRLPASLRALLSARVDALPDSRRSVLDAAAVCGRDFFRAPRARLVPEEARELIAHLAALTVAGLIERGYRDGAPATGITALFGADRYAFAHALVRDAVLEALPKGRAAELHEAFAGLLEAEPDAPLPIVAWHLDRAATLRLELEPLHAGPVVQRAADALEAAGQEALARDDVAAARGLRSRAAELFEAASAAI